MKRVVIFGTGKHYVNHKRLLDQDWEIIAFIDSNVAKQGKEYEGKPVMAPVMLQNTGEYDYVVIASTMKEEMIRQLLSMKIPADRIRLLNCYRLADPAKVNIRVLASGEVEYQMERLSFTCRTRSDFNVVQEIFDDGNYNYRDGREQDTLVIDIGMNIGLASLYFAQRKHVREVFAFEPFCETYEQAAANIEKNPPDIKEKIHMFPWGLGKDTCKKYFHYDAAFSGGISTVGDGEKKGELETVPVEIRDAGDELRPILQRKEKIILKMDCEGSEYEIMESLDQAGILFRIDVFLVEWHNPDDNDRLEELLKKHGYTYLLFPGNDTRGFLYGFR